MNERSGLRHLGYVSSPTNTGEFFSCFVSPRFDFTFRFVYCVILRCRLCPVQMFWSAHISPSGCVNSRCCQCQQRVRVQTNPLSCYGGRCHRGETSGARPAGHLCSASPEGSTPIPQPPTGPRFTPSVLSRGHGDLLNPRAPPRH